LVHFVIKVINRNQIFFLNINY